MPASWRRYLARRLMRRQRFPARPKPLPWPHKLFHTTFTSCLDLFSCYPPPDCSNPVPLHIVKSQGSPFVPKTQPAGWPNQARYPTILLVQYIFKYVFYLFFVMKTLLFKQCIMHWWWSRIFNFHLAKENLKKRERELYETSSRVNGLVQTENGNSWFCF